MRRAFRTSRLLASVVATFLYLSFEEAMRARAARAADGNSALDRPEARTRTLSVHERPTLPGTVDAPIRDLVEISRVAKPQPRPAVLFAVREEADPIAEPGESLDVATLLGTLRRDVGCRDGRSHEACRAAEALADFMDRDAVIAALEETVTAAGRPGCVSAAGVRSLGRSSHAAARTALKRMLSVARGRADWGSAPSDRDLVALLLRTLDARG